MSDLDSRLEQLLREHDSTLEAPQAEENFYKEVLGSFRGEGSGMRIMTWVGILIFGGLLIYCVVQLVLAETTRDQILFGSFAVMLNSAQIALKLWFNMRLNRRAIVAEVRKLRLDLANA